MSEVAPLDSDASKSQDAGERQRLMRDAIANNLSVPVSAIVGILLVPVMLKALGQNDYGLWIVVTSISGIVAAVDFGLYWSVARVVAADPMGKESDTSDFVRSAANVFLLVGIVGCVMLGGVGFLMRDRLQLPAVEHETAILVFWLVGGALCADRISAFGSAVLNGLRRFELINIITAVASVTWALGVVALLINGGSILAVAGFNLAVAVLKGGGTLWIVTRRVPAFRYRPLFLRWGALRQHMVFAVSSLLIDVLSNITWNIAPVLIGFVSGPAAAVPFYIGQKFPVAVSGMSWRAAEVLFPAASENQNDPVRSEEVLRVGSRWVLVLALPFAILLIVAAPGLLRAWVGNTPPGTVMVLRILAATVVADAIMVTPLHMLWGRGAVRPILLVYAAQGFGTIILTLALAAIFGVAGAATGMLISIGVSAFVFLVVASREYDLSAWNLAAGAYRGLTLPILACSLSTLSVLYLGDQSRLWVILAMAVGGFFYMAVLFGFSGSSEEKRFASDVYRRLRSAVAGLPFLRSFWYFAIALSEFARDPWRNPSYFEWHFATPDPWHYETGEDRKRLILADSMLKRVQQAKFRKAIEIGCAEGVFTEMLAPRCESLIAVDFAPIALQRARQRLQHTDICFETFDLRRDPIPGTFDLITAMDILDTIFRPAVLKRVRNKLVDGLEPGGYLLLVDPRQNKMFETEWWGPLLLRGGKNVRDFIGRHSSLRLVFEDSTETHVFALFRKETA